VGEKSGQGALKAKIFRAGLAPRACPAQGRERFFPLTETEEHDTEAIGDVAVLRGQTRCPPEGAKSSAWVAREALGPGEVEKDAKILWIVSCGAREDTTPQTRFPLAEEGQAEIMLRRSGGLVLSQGPPEVLDGVGQMVSTVKSDALGTEDLRRKISLGL